MYFKHSETAQDELKLAKLRSDLGAEGYGLYWMLLERIHREDAFSIGYDISIISFLLGASAEKVEQIITSYGLFEERNGRLYSLELEAGLTKRKPRKTKSYKKVKIETQLPENVCDEPIPQSPTIAKVQTQSCENVLRKDTSKETPNNEAPNIIKTGSNTIRQDAEEGDVEYTYDPFPEKIIELWNKIFANSKARFRGTTLSSVGYYNLQACRQTFGEDLNEYKTIFETALHDTFAWTLESVLKPNNMTQLLAKKEKNDQRNLSATQSSGDTSDDEIPFYETEEYARRRAISGYESFKDTPVSEWPEGIAEYFRRYGLPVPEK